jgi:hypothetical protein
MVQRYIVQSQPPPPNTVWPFEVLSIGFLLFAIHDTELNLVGSLFALAAAVMTTICQVQTTTLARQTALTTAQINTAIAFPRFIAALVAAISIEAKAIMAHDFQEPELALILSSGFLAAIGDGVGAWLGNRIGPIDRVIGGHVKTGAIIGLALLLFPGREEGTTKKVRRMLGICIAFVGAIVHSINERKNQEIENRALVAFREEEEQIEAPVAHIVPGIEFEKSPLDQNE